ncbi:DNA polymerase III subunit delta [Marinicauda salina]|uniref:DNA-directed DNA polymerase n=1 Tax=Marinicauda salina TaxID=2135793 RepID=A0A2U2BWH2_9PROT|nr:DNA polymerase III subunit delta [Marinicauda salina]PWE18347.1 DNA polymerase III subunit delta [Marinicauda salina]
MKVKAREVDAAVARPKPDIAAFLVFGPDLGLVRERAERLATALVADPADPFCVSRLTDEDLKAEPSALADAMAALSLTGGDRLVRLRLASDSAPTAAWLADLEAGSAAAEARLVIEAGDLKPGSKLRKAAEAGAHTLALPCYADDARDLLGLAEESFAAEAIEIAPDARSMLGTLLEGDRRLARGEIEKLMLYKGLKDQRGGETATVERADIAAVSAAGAEAALDQAIDTALAGDVAAADRGYARVLASGANPVGVLRALQRKIDQIDAFHAAGGDASALARSGAPRFGPPAERFRRTAGLWRGRRLDRARRLAFDAERQVKRAGAPAEAIVGELLLRLARAARDMR